MKTLTELFTGFYNTLKSKKFGKAYGLATLDDTGRIPFEQLPESAMTYEGNWNASTNTPTLTNGVGTKGMFYVVDVGGTWNSIVFVANDRIIYDGTSWKRLPAGAVSSVNGKSGAVVLDGTEIKYNSSTETSVSDMIGKVKTTISGEDKSNYITFADSNGNTTPADLHTSGTLTFNPVSRNMTIPGDGGFVTNLGAGSGSFIGQNGEFVSIRTNQIQVAKLLGESNLGAVTTINDNISTRDISAKDISASGTISATGGFTGNLTGTASKATSDADGNNIKNTYATKSSLSTVATSGSYNDLSNKPTIPSMQSIFDIVHPIGEIYVRYPGSSAPATLYNKDGITSTWTKQSYAGAFFRADGGNASSFITGTTWTKQKAQAPSITGSTRAIYYRQETNLESGALKTTKVSDYWDSNSGSGYVGYRGTIAFNSSNSGASSDVNGENIYTASGELRPANLTIEIYKRTA